MFMSTGKLIALRLFNITLGRFSLLTGLLRKILVWYLIGSQPTGRTYCASSRFFSFQELVGEEPGLDVCDNRQPQADTSPDVRPPCLGE